MNNFLPKAYELKNLERAGWSRVGVTDSESVAAHSWGVAFLCLQFCPPNLSKEKVLMMALLHDIPEVEVGDITPHDGITKAEKSRREIQAAQKLLPSDLYELWKECHDKITPEAKFINMMDKLDMLIQAKVYSHKANTNEFIESAQKVLSQSTLSTEIQDLLTEIQTYPGGQSN